MIMAPRILWLIVLTGFVCGCSTMRTARWPDTPTEPGADDHGLSVVAIGDLVTVERLDETCVSGRVRAITAESVTVGNERWLNGKLSLETHAIPRAEIRAVSKLHTHVGRTILLAGGIVIGMGIYLVSAALDDMKFDFSN